MNHNEALTKQVYTFASELYAYGVREVVLVPAQDQRHWPLLLKHILILRHGYILMNVVQRFCFRLNKGSERPGYFMYFWDRGGKLYTSNCREPNQSYTFNCINK